MSPPVMRAIRLRRYGGPEVLRLEQVAVPAVGDDEVLVRIRAASANPLDYHFMRGRPYVLRLQAGVRRPKVDALGVDLAGDVAAVGGNVTALRPGDEVFGGGGRRGAFGEYLCLPADALLAKPANLSFEQAAAVPVAGFTALQALRDKARISPGGRVLVNGAAGGVGSFTVQIAKALGAEVTGVCSTRNVDLVRSLGADEVVDYTRSDFTRTDRRYDVLIDIAGNRSLADTRRVLTRTGVHVWVGGPKRGAWIRPLLGPVKMAVVNPFVRRTLTPMLARPNHDDLAALGDLLAAGKLTPVIDRTYPLGETAEAIAYLETGHARGKVVITL
jgi:NADPH:quinone reductase-like Zn-dependent oxidoreductase